MPRVHLSRARKRSPAGRVRALCVPQARFLLSARHWTLDTPHHDSPPLQTGRRVHRCAVPRQRWPSCSTAPASRPGDAAFHRLGRSCRKRRSSCRRRTRTPITASGFSVPAASCRSRSSHARQLPRLARSGRATAVKGAHRAGMRAGLSRAIRRDGDAARRSPRRRGSAGPRRRRGPRTTDARLADPARRTSSPRWCDNGPPWQAVLLRSAAQVLSLSPDRGVLDGLVRRRRRAARAADAECAFEVRAFFPGPGGLVEDPVTGSLNAAVGKWLIDGGARAESQVRREAGHGDSGAGRPGPRRTGRELAETAGSGAIPSPASTAATNPVDTPTGGPVGLRRLSLAALLLRRVRPCHTCRNRFPTVNA